MSSPVELHRKACRIGAVHHRRRGKATHWNSSATGRSALELSRALVDAAAAQAMRVSTLGWLLLEADLGVEPSGL